MAGVGAVLGFVPQILVLCFLLALLEDVGYMARIAFVMDRIFRRFGLSGKSFIPLLVATGCGVPGILASRTIEQDRDRKMTIMTTGFIPCGAKLPIIGLFAGAVFGNSPWVSASAFFIGIAAVVVSGIILKKFKAFAGEPAPFVMELPAYHLPSLSNALRSTWDRGWAFIKRAGTVILISSIVLWFLQGYGFVDGVFQAVEDNNHSILAAIGNAIAWIFYPLGWIGDMAWKATVATFTGLIAKEEVVNFFRRGLQLRRRDRPDGGQLPHLGHGGRGLQRHHHLLLHDLQPAVRPLLRRHGRHQAGDEQLEVDPGRYRLHVRLRLRHRHDRLPDRRPHRRRGHLQRLDRGGRGRSGGPHLPPVPQGLSGQGGRPGTCAPSPPPTSDLDGTDKTATSFRGANRDRRSAPLLSICREGGAAHGMLKRPSAVSAGDRPPLGRGRGRLLRGGGQGTGGKKALGGQDAGDPPGEGPGGERAVRQDRPHPRRNRDRPPVPEAAGAAGCRVSRHGPPPDGTGGSDRRRCSPGRPSAPILGGIALRNRRGPPGEGGLF